MVALGTVISPMRALIRERLRARDRGVKIGPMALFFGVRYKVLISRVRSESLVWRHENLLSISP